MLLSRGFIYPFSPLFSRERTLFARGDRFSFLFFLLSLRPDRGQRGLLSFAACLLVSRCVSRGPLLVSWDLSMDTLVGRLFFFLPFLHLALIVCSLQLYLAKQGDQLFCAISYQLLSMSAVPFSSCWNWL